MLGGTDIATEKGSRVWLYGDLLKPKMDGECIPYPTVEYTVDGCPGESTDRNAASLGAYLILHYSPIPKTSH